MIIKRLLYNCLFYYQGLHALKPSEILYFNNLKILACIILINLYIEIAHSPLNYFQKN